MAGLRIGFITAAVVIALLMVFVCYQYFWLGNENIVRGPHDQGFSFILIFLLMVYTFVLGLVSFIPSMVSIFIGGNLFDRVFPVFISVVSIGVTLLISFEYIIPVLEHGE